MKSHRLQGNNETFRLVVDTFCKVACRVAMTGLCRSNTQQHRLNKTCATYSQHACSERIYDRLVTEIGGRQHAYR